MQAMNIIKYLLTNIHERKWPIPFDFFNGKLLISIVRLKRKGNPCVRVLLIRLSIDAPKFLPPIV